MWVVKMTECRVKSSSYKLKLDDRIIDVEIETGSSPAIYKVVQRSRNALDSSIYVKKPITIIFVSRLSSDELSTLKNIFSEKEISVKLGEWAFDGWFRDRKIVWDYRKEDAERPWKVTFIVDSTSYEFPAPPSGLFIDGFEEDPLCPPWTDTQILGNSSTIGEVSAWYHHGSRCLYCVARDTRIDQARGAYARVYYNLEDEFEEYHIFFVWKCVKQNESNYSWRKLGVYGSGGLLVGLREHGVSDSRYFVAQIFNNGIYYYHDILHITHGIEGHVFQIKVDIKVGTSGYVKVYVKDEDTFEEGIVEVNVNNSAKGNINKIELGETLCGSIYAPYASSYFDCFKGSPTDFTGDPFE